ncbi:tripartite tricarboxylate transporter substrate binding protein [Achromobacter sp. F4_2707]|uniref:Bug family tripartite tricarboxylate transporter substrate binding protein n=1 Tax=Achromobacter sp. F4_2707 TaxID=3114286 RepID=UPI0039C60B04
MLKKFMAASVLAASLAGFAVPASAADYPSQPVRLIVSNNPGGPVDLMGRLLAEKLHERWGQAVIVENRPGASSIISTNLLAKSKPDGHTLALVVASAVTIVPFATKSLPFDPQKDLQPISMVARTPFLFVVREDSPLKSWKDFEQAARQQDLSIGSFSIGTAFHLTWEQVARQLGIEALYVPTSSSSKTQSDVVNGQLDIALDTPSSARALIEGGRLRPLALTGAQRFSGLPDTPTLLEEGVDYAAEPWIGLMAPAGIDQTIVDELQQAVAEILQTPDMLAQMTILGMVPAASSPAEFQQVIDADRQAMEPLIKELGISLQP